KAVVLPRKPQISREQQQEENQSALDNAYAALQGENHLDNPLRIRRTRCHQDHANQRHDDTSPTKDQGAEITQRRKRTEDVAEDLANDHKAQHGAHGRSRPIQIEIAPALRAAEELSREQEGEDHYLGHDIGEKHGHDLAELAPEHDGGHDALQHGVGDPKTVHGVTDHGAG